MSDHREGSVLENGLDQIVLRISESALDRMLQRIRLASGFNTDQSYEFNSLGFSKVEARLELRESRLRLRQADGGAVRFDLAIRAEFRFGLPYPDRRIDLSCAVLVKPELGRVGNDGLVLSTDFASARLRDVRARRSSRGGMLGFDPSGLDPFAEDRWGEMAKLALRAALRKLGSRQGKLTGGSVERLLKAASDTSTLAIVISDHEIEIRATANASTAVDVAAEPRNQADARLTLGDSVLTRLSDDFMKTRTWGNGWRIESLRIRSSTREIHVDAEILPRVPYWPESWRIRLRAGLSPRLDARGIGLRLEDLGGDGPVLPNWTRRLILRALATRLEERSWQRSLSLRVPLSEDEHWNLELGRIELRDGSVDLVLDTDPPSG